MDTDGPAFESIGDLRAWCERAPDGTRLEARAVASILATVGVDPARDARGDQKTTGASPEGAWSWRERLWMAPAETRLGVAEVAEAFGRPKSWVYARTQKYEGKGKGRKERDPRGLLPHRKLDGALLFTAGELRAWVRSHEEELVGGPMESTPHERGLRVVR